MEFTEQKEKTLKELENLETIIISKFLSDADKLKDVKVWNENSKIMLNFQT